jgi:hypothetical protein
LIDIPLSLLLDRWPLLFLASRPNPAARHFGNNNYAAIETCRMAIRLATAAFYTQPLPGVLSH